MTTLPLDGWQVLMTLLPDAMTLWPPGVLSPLRKLRWVMLRLRLPGALRQGGAPQPNQ